jgi:hypothetical protein
MEALRVLKKPENGTITITLPDKLKDQDELEIIVLPVEKKVKKKKDFDPRKYFGVAKLNMTIEEIDEECKKMRDEWDRGF